MLSLSLAVALGAILAGSALPGLTAVGILPPQALVAVGPFVVAALLYSTWWPGSCWWRRTGRPSPRP